MNPVKKKHTDLHQDLVLSLCLKLAIQFQAIDQITLMLSYMSEEYLKPPYF